MVARNKDDLPLLPLGVSDWSTIRENKLFFVDKTAKLGELVRRNFRVFFARPRRMGKTTLCSMLEDLFTHGDRNFAGTAIYGKWPETKRYPVLNLSFYKADCQSASVFETNLCKMVIDAYYNAGFKDVVQYVGMTSFDNLTSLLPTIVTGKQQLVILIDEWDYPLSTHLDDPSLFASLQTVLAKFYRWLRLQQANARFILVTGIMRYHDVSLFTGQDIQDLSMDPAFADLVGYTQTELEDNFGPYIAIASQKFGITTDELQELLKLQYDGFCFDKEASVTLYSPFSINKFFQPVLAPDFLQNTNVKLYLDSFWMNSAGASSALRSFLRARQYDVTALLEKYSQPVNLTLSALTSPVNASDVTLDQIMLQSGMLTIREVADKTQYGPSSTPSQYKCEITNYEVSTELSAVFTASMTDTKTETDFYPMLRDAQKALCSGNIASVCTNLNLLLNDSLYDVFHEADEEDEEAGADSDKRPPKENIYRTLFKMWLRSALVSTQDEVANSHGRCDLVATTKDTIYAFELKRVRSNTERTKKAMLNKAERQMADNDYCNNLINRGKLVVWVVLVICDAYHQIVAWRTITHTKLATGVHTERHEDMVEPIIVPNQEWPISELRHQHARQTKTVRHKTADKANGTSSSRVKRNKAASGTRGASKRKSSHATGSKSPKARSGRREQGSKKPQ